MRTVLMTRMTHTQEMTQDGDNVINLDDIIPVLRHPTACAWSPTWWGSTRDAAGNTSAR